MNSRGGLRYPKEDPTLTITLVSSHRAKITSQQHRFLLLVCDDVTMWVHGWAPNPNLILQMDHAVGLDPSL